MAPGSRIEPELANKVTELAEGLYPDRRVDIWFHPQCFESSGHFAGDDAIRARAFLDVANDWRFDALWFARGGYGACRLAEAVLPALAEPARRKTYLGYSDAGSLLGALYGRGFPHVAHGPMPADIRRPGGAAAVRRALAFLVDGAGDALEASVANPGGEARPAAAFNITILGHLLGTPYQPDLAGHVLMLEEVSEHLYRIDRTLWQITSNPAIRRVAGIMLGRCSDIPPNLPDFGQDEAGIAAAWCARSGIPYLGRADIGHDIENKVVPFGVWQR